MVTLALGLLGPLLYLGVGVLLVVWGRHQARAGKGRAAQIGWMSPLIAMLAAVLGAAGTAVLLVRSFDDTASVPPESRALHVADGISSAMTALAIGMGLSVTLYVVSVVANLIATSRRRPPQTTTPPP